MRTKCLLHQSAPPVNNVPASLPAQARAGSLCLLRRENDSESWGQGLFDLDPYLLQRPPLGADEGQAAFLDGGELLTGPVGRGEPAVRGVQTHLHARHLGLFKREGNDFLELPLGRFRLFDGRRGPEPVDRLDELGDLGRRRYLRLAGLVQRGRGKDQPRLPPPPKAISSSDAGSLPRDTIRLPTMASSPSSDSAEVAKLAASLFNCRALRAASMSAKIFSISHLPKKITGPYGLRSALIGAETSDTKNNFSFLQATTSMMGWRKGERS